MALCKFYNRKDRKAFPGVSRIMHISGCSRSSVFRGINELKEKGLIIVKKKDNPAGFSHNVYILPDFLLFELNQAKSPSARQTLASAIQTLLSVFGDTSLVSEGHSNYIINHITNNLGSFNNQKSEKPKDYNELLGQRLAEYWGNKEPGD